MSRPGLALVPVLLASTGIGANIGPASSPTAGYWLYPSRGRA
jgi:hypothetical protein